MKAILTGMKGTVAPYVAREWESLGNTAVAWDRDLVPSEDRDAAEKFIAEVQPDVFFHIGMGSPEWAAMLAEICASHGIRFTFTGTVSVYGEHQHGPFAPDDIPEPSDDYGRYKLECERQILDKNPEALIVRIGWQIGDAPGSNNMVDFFDRQMLEKGVIEANVNWVPGCSLLPDTARTLVELTNKKSSGLYHLDANYGLNHFLLALGMSNMHGFDWTIEPIAGAAKNTLMHDPRVNIKKLSEYPEYHFTSDVLESPPYP